VPTSREVEQPGVTEFMSDIVKTMGEISHRSRKHFPHYHLRHNRCPFQIVTIVGPYDPRRKWLQVLAERAGYTIVQRDREFADERRGRTWMIRMALAREVGDEGHDAQLAFIAVACSPHEFNLVVQSFCLQIDGHLGLLRQSMWDRKNFLDEPTSPIHSE
jgi:hypothetical protein